MPKNPRRGIVAANGRTEAWDNTSAIPTNVLVFLVCLSVTVCGLVFIVYHSIGDVKDTMDELAKKMDELVQKMDGLVKKAN